MKRRRALASGLLLAGALRPDARAGDELLLRWSPQMGPRATFRGVLNKDSAGMGAGQFLYPAPNVAGFFAAILAHAAVNSAARDAQMLKLQTNADRVLEPYSAAIDGLAADDLLTRTRTALLPQGLVIRRGWVNANLELTPIFLMTQDRRAVLLDVAAQFHDGASGAPRQLGMRVVSTPRGTFSAEEDEWANAEGHALKQVCVDLLTLAVRHMLDHVDPDRAPAATSVERTVRFAEGGTQRMERSRVLEQHCGRALLLTLSNTLMSVPLLHPPAPGQECPAAMPSPQVATGR
ncbi:hypothetical protein [Roseateles sp.]|uniref:hypothetical protein n=1 Tax=Roseateles sp. TaxID=1971397 RepID=UPI002ED92924